MGDRVKVTVEIEPCHHRHKRTPYMVMSLGCPTARGAAGGSEGESNSVALTLTDIEQAPAKIDKIVDLEGNAAQVEGSPTWESSDPAIATVTPAADGMSATIASVGPVGQATVTVKADADLGEGVKTIQADILVDVTASEATGLVVSTGTPEPRPL